MTSYKLLSFAALLLAATLSTGCSHHAPTSADLFNDPSAIPSGKLPYNPLQWKVITSAIDPQQKTMSTLYGNDMAVRSARAGDASYPDGSLLSLVTWSQRDDAHWFGARIPNELRSVEFVTIAGKDTFYQRYQGPSLEKASQESPQDESTKKDAILTLKAPFLP